MHLPGIKTLSIWNLLDLPNQYFCRLLNIHLFSTRTVSKTAVCNSVAGRSIFTFNFTLIITTIVESNG